MVDRLVPYLFWRTFLLPNGSAIIEATNHHKELNQKRTSAHNTLGHISTTTNFCYICHHIDDGAINCKTCRNYFHPKYVDQDDPNGIYCFICKKPEKQPKKDDDENDEHDGGHETLFLLLVDSTGQEEYLGSQVHEI